MLVTSLMNRDLEKGLRHLGLTEARARVIWELSTGDSLTQRDLAERLSVTPRNVTTLIDGLEKTGFVVRTAHVTDRRAIVLILSDKGVATADKLQRDMSTFARDLFGDLESTDLEALLKILKRSGLRLEELLEVD